MPQTYTDVVDLLIPELRRRGIFWDDYCVPGGTYRENVYEIPGQAEPLEDHVAATMIWRPPKDNGLLTNGANGSVNGHLEADEDAVDPISMQLS